MTAQYAYLLLFFVAAYLIVFDNSISSALLYLIDIFKNRIARQIWWIKNNPQNPIVKYLMWRRSLKLAEELLKELNEKK